MKLPYDYRLWLFQKLMKGPFMVAPFISILIKCLLPLVLGRMQRLARRSRLIQKGERGPRRGCEELAAGIVRIASLIFALDGGRAGCLRYVVAGSPFKDVPETGGREAEAVSSEAVGDWTGAAEEGTKEELA